MESWVEEIEDWDARSFSGGYAGLRDLADREFSGAVSSGSAWLFMVNGRVVGVVERRQTATGSEVVDAALDRFEDAEGTTYGAPDPSVPLLFAMQTADGETRAKYYTEDTPLREVHETLTDGGFTGYIELSENVLSGDYYVVYQGGHAMELAFIGNARRLLTDDEAFDRAADEVGIYEVTAVELDVADVPEPEGTAGGDGAAGTAGAAGGAGAAAGTATGSAPGADAAGTEADDGGGDGSQGEAVTTPAGADADDGAEAAGGQAATEPGDAAETEAAANAAATDETGGSEAGTEADETRPDEAGTGTTGGGTATDDADGTQAPTDTTAGDGPTDPTPEAGTIDEGAPDGGAAGAETSPTNADQAAGTTEQQGRAGDQSRTGTGSDPGRSPTGDDRPAGNQSRPTDAANAGGGRPHRQDDTGGAPDAGSPTDQLVDRTIPSLDPDRTGVGDGGAAAGGTGTGAGTDRAQTGTAGQSGGRETGGRQELRDELAERERELEEARSALEEVRDERETLRDERDELRGTVEELRRRVDELESDVERARTAAREAGAATGEGPTLSAAEAFAGTNLFVRYDSKSELTLEDAHGGAGDPEELAANLALEHHTQFDSDGASVGGRAFDSWLRTTQEFRFVRWLVTELLFEIRETGAADAMRDLYDALPEVDRVEIDAAVDVETEEGTEHREFDLVARDRMGQPLVVANLDDSRQPVSEGEMADLVGACTEVCHTQETLSGAFFVATSFFDPDALETARDATSDSLLSRDKRRSFVKLSRKHGFHLGLVEDRDSSFHLSIPDL